MALNPKNVQQAVRLAVALANPKLREQDWTQLKDRFQLDDHLLSGVKILIETCGSHPELKPVLVCLTHNP
jgi:hypothetical protein